LALILTVTDSNRQSWQGLREADRIRARPFHRPRAAPFEDSTGDRQNPIYDFGLAVERIRAAVEVARSLSFPFTLTARAENFLYGRTDLDDTIRRLQAFEAAGADVLYAPGDHDLATIKTVVSALKKPFNLVMGFADPTLTVEQVSAAGVKRIRVGGALSRYALAAFLRCAREMKERGSFTFVREMAPIKDIRQAFAKGAP
jgi:2-methylisocitrate lyase-like PEP mutase family enzyme